MTPRPLEDYIEHADDLAQEVVNAWGINVSAGNAAYLTAPFKDLLETACQYQTAKRIADNHREFNFLTEKEAANEKATRNAFAEVYKAHWESHHP